MQMSPKTPHKALQTEAASSGLNSTLFPVQCPPSGGKGSARIFSLWLGEGGGTQGLRLQGLGAALVQWLVPRPRVENQPEGAMTHWPTLRGQAKTAARLKLVQRESASREAVDAFRSTKAALM